VPWLEPKWLFLLRHCHLQFDDVEASSLRFDDAEALSLWFFDHAEACPLRFDDALSLWFQEIRREWTVQKLPGKSIKRNLLVAVPGRTDVLVPYCVKYSNGTKSMSSFLHMEKSTSF
jgi:hypothetical protein